MSEKRFGWNYFENEVVIGDRQDKKRMIVVVFSNFMCIPYNRKSFDELVDWLNKLYEENERLRNQLERKTILLKIRTKHIDDREKSFHELLNYLESFCYKSNIDGNYAKQDIINILNNWEIREYD